VTNIKLYLDEDVEVFLADAVRRRGYEANTTRDCGNLGNADLAQIAFAHRNGSVILTHNVQDFPRLHYEITGRNEHHNGFIVAKKESPTIILRRLLKLLTEKSAEDMQDMLEYLSSWSVD
jgi:predicted nuclease of predicted toxin-antitoxin system